MVSITLGTTFMKVVCWDNNEWDYSCRIMDLPWHMAKEDAKAECEEPAAAKGSEPENLKLDQVAIKDKQLLHPGGLQSSTGQAGP